MRILERGDLDAPVGDGRYKVEYTDGGVKYSCTVKVIVEGSRVLFDGIE